MARINRLPKLSVFSIAVFILAILPFVLPYSYILHVMIWTLLFAYLSEAWNLLGGYAGQLSLGHCIYFAIGAYTSTLLYVWWGVSPWLGMLTGAIIAVMFATGIGSLTFRLTGTFFALSTFAFSEIFRYVLINSPSITSGSLGILLPLLQRDSIIDFQFIGRMPFYYIILTLMLAAIFVMRRITRSKLGYYLVSIREDAIAASFMGINVFKYKLIANAISAFMVAPAGTFYAQYIHYISPDSTAVFSISLYMILLTLIGGKGTVVGPIIGSFILTPVTKLLDVLLGGTAGFDLIAYGTILVAVVLIAPEGLMGLIQKRRK